MLFKPQGLASEAKPGRKAAAAQTIGAFKQLQSIHGLILWSCYSIAGPSPCCSDVEPTSPPPPCLAPPRCDLELLAQDSISLRPDDGLVPGGFKFWGEKPGNSDVKFTPSLSICPFIPNLLPLQNSSVSGCSSTCSRF